jgi:hypothetical protein
MLICSNCFKRELNYSKTCSDHNKDRCESIEKDRKKNEIVIEQRKSIQRHIHRVINEFNKMDRR